MRRREVCDSTEKHLVRYITVPPPLLGQSSCCPPATGLHMAEGAGFTYYD
jgi:hypothetical protein